MSVSIPHLNRIAWGLRAALRYKVRRALGSPARTLEEVAQREWTITPGEVESAVPPFIAEDHFARIRDSVLGQSREEILSELGATTLHHRPTRGFLLRDVVLFDRAFYCGMHKEALYRGMGIRGSIFRSSPAEFVKAVWASSYAGSRWFGHFLRDELALQELARTLGFMIGHERPLYAHEIGWRFHLDSPRPATLGIARVKELIALDDVGLHSGKRKRFKILRERLASRPRGHERVLFLRGHENADERKLINEEEVVARLVREGFHVVDPSRLEVAEIISQCRGAKVVVTVEGSHAAPILYMAEEGAAIVYIFPPARVAAHSPRLASLFGMRPGLFVGEQSNGSPGLFRADPEELVRTIEHIHARVPLPASG